MATNYPLIATLGTSRFCWCPSAPQTLSVTLDAKGNCGYRALHGPHSHMTLGPLSPQHLLRLLVIHNLHQHGPGGGCWVPWLDSGDHSNAPAECLGSRSEWRWSSILRRKSLLPPQFCIPASLGSQRLSACVPNHLSGFRRKSTFSLTQNWQSKFSRPPSQIPICC